MLRLPSFIVFIALSCLPGTAPAQQDAGTRTQPRANRVVEATVADHPSVHYRFERLHIDSIDGKRHYRIEIGIPWARTPEKGYPVLYMLDGNAAMEALTNEDLAMLSNSNPPVLVAVGYDVNTRLDVASRAYDYTPSVREEGRLVAQPVVRGRMGGGADTFLRFLDSQVKALVKARARLDPDKVFLWGHSYGGLFALHALFTRPDTFSGYIAGDPSLWWHDGALMDAWRAFEPDHAAGKRIAILVGAKPRDPAKPAPSARADSQRNRSVDLRMAAEEIARGLRPAGADVSFETFPQYGHGEMLRASLTRALHIASEP